MKCNQTKCCFHASRGLAMMCPCCDDCKAESNDINEDCVNCWNCLKDEGYIRSGVPKFMKSDVKQQEKEVEVETR